MRHRFAGVEYAGVENAWVITEMENVAASQRESKSRHRTQNIDIFTTTKTDC